VVVVAALVVVVAAASVVPAALLSLLHAAAAPTRASRASAAPKRRPAACREGCREGCPGVSDRGEYMVIATSKELGGTRRWEREAFRHGPFCPVEPADFCHPRDWPCDRSLTRTFKWSGLGAIG
jgi:hypothetical protein